jgi:GNAT superfamily N-acetyltransferase
MIPKMKLRAPNLDDANFIFNSWLKSYRNSAFAKPQCNTVYYSNYKAIVNNLLERGLVLVACNEEDESQVFGYIVYEDLPNDNLLAHYIYVKHTYRKMGIAKRLISSVRKNNNPVLISHHSKLLDTLNNDLRVIYDPFRALYDSIIR